ncbi:MAG: dUTP diphosphatase [Sporomusaceae bacterium]|nr:dUTP diphosphatase [Sporomusaceae bacterium]
MKQRGFCWVKQYETAGFALPKRSTRFSAGYDIAAVSTLTLMPQTVTLVPTGLKAYMQSNEYLGIHIRSSLAVKSGICLANGQGIIDADYYDNPDNEGHIMLALLNLSKEPFEIVPGMRLAQGIFYSYLTVDQDETPAERQGGFGSTGK